MIKNIFPLGNGAGIFQDKKLCVSIVDENGNKKVGGKLFNKNIKISSLFFIRGIFYFFYNIYLYFLTYRLARKIEIDSSENSKQIKITKNLTLTSDFIFLLGGILFAFIFALLGLNYLPNYIFNSIFANEANYYLKSFMLGLFKVAILFIVFAVLKICPFTNGIYRFNSAGCNFLCDKSNKHTFIWQAYPLNFLNLLLNTSILSIFVVSLVAVNIFWLADIFINIAIYLVCIGVVYEFLYFATYSKWNWLKDITLITNFFVCNKPKTTHNEVLAVIKNEIASYDSFDNVDTNRVPLSAVFAEMETKLRASDKYEPSDVDWIIGNVLNKNRAELKLLRSVTQKEYREIMRCCDRRAKGEPLSNIFGFVEFYGLKFDVNKKVLSPRMETEILAEEVIKKIKEHSFNSVLDLCTGSGAIAITIAKFTDCKVVASDISKQALAVAENNARKNNVKVDFVCSDLFNSLKKTKKYDIIVSNPPYIKTNEIEKLDTEVKNYDPKLALDGGEDGLEFYRKIIKDGSSKLNKGGFIFFELGNGQRKDVQNLLEKEGFEDICIIKDYNRIERIIYGRKCT